MSSGKSESVVVSVLTYMLTNKLKHTHTPTHTQARSRSLSLSSDTWSDIGTCTSRTFLFSSTREGRLGRRSGSAPHLVSRSCCLLSSCPRHEKPREISSILYLGYSSSFSSVSVFRLSSFCVGSSFGFAFGFSFGVSPSNPEQMPIFPSETQTRLKRFSLLDCGFTERETGRRAAEEDSSGEKERARTFSDGNSPISLDFQVTIVQRSTEE